MAAIDDLIAKRGADGKEHFYRLDMGKDAVRKQVLAVGSNGELDRLFAAEGRLR